MWWWATARKLGGCYWGLFHVGGLLAYDSTDKKHLQMWSPHTQTFTTTMPFLTVSAITYSWMASTAPQADSWWLGHVEPDDVVIADIAGQALDIFLHGPESAHKNGIAKTFTHTSIPIHPCTLLKKRKNNNSKMLNSPNMMPLFTSPLPVQCFGGRFSGSLALAPRRTPCRLGHF